MESHGSRRGRGRGGRGGQHNQNREHTSSEDPPTRTWRGANHRGGRAGGGPTSGGGHQGSRGHHRHPYPANSRAEAPFRERVWMPNEPPALPESSVNDVTFTVMSYNCLAPSLAAKNMYLYNTQQRKHGRDVLSWSFRGPNLVKDIAARKSEIVCLQEIDDVCFQYFEQQMTQLGYKGTYVRCTGAKIDGVALFAKSSIFEVDACEHINYHPNKDNAAIVMILSIPHLKRKICVATTHLVWSPKRGEVKLAQIQMLTERMRLLVQTHEAKINATIPVVLCGDFNLTPASMLYHFLTTGVMDIRDGSNKTMSGQFSRALAYVGKDSASFPFRAACHEGIMANAGQENIIPVSIQPKVTPPQHSAIISHPFDFASVYAPYKHPTDGSRMFTSWHDSDQDLVDFIFFGGLNTTSSATTDPQQRQRYQQTVLECLRCLATPLAQQCGKMPSPSAPSDHIPLVAQFRLSIV